MTISKNITSPFFKWSSQYDNPNIPKCHIIIFKTTILKWSYQTGNPKIDSKKQKRKKKKAFNQRY